MIEFIRGDRSMSIKKLLSYISIGAFVGSLALFQNCGGPTDSVYTADSASAASYSDAPFAYDVQVNQLTYMSCSISSNNFTGQNLNALSNRSAFFTLAIGAYDQSGIKLTSEFNTYAQQKLNKGTAIDPTRVENALENSTINQGVQLHLAIRSRTNPSDSNGILQETNFSTTKSSEPGMNTALLLSPLSLPYIASILKNAFTDRVNYFNGGTIQSQRALEANIAFLGVESASQVRTFLQNNYYMTLTFQGAPGADGTTTSVAVSEPKSGETPKVYGVGYGLSFASPNPKSPNNVVSAVTEFDMANPGRQTGGTWSCPTNLRYKIISPVHAALNLANTTCPAISDSALAALDLANKTTLVNDRNILKRHLDLSYWRINPQLKCVVPIVQGGGDCYSNTALIAGAPPVEYQATTVDCGPGKGRDCAEYVSVCLRN